MAVPLFDTRTPLAPHLAAIIERIAAVVEDGRFVLGPEVEAFERELAGYLGVRHAIGVGNGTDALVIALRALGVGAGDEVVLPSFTFYATAEAVAGVGATPIFCDVDPGTRNVTPETVRAVLTPQTKAVIAVDLFGCPAPVAEIRELGLPVLEDAAQAAGATYRGARAGALGDMATLSFYPSKNLGCFGDGGAIATDDDELAEIARSLRFHGSRDKQTFQYVGYNSRLDEVQAAVLRVLLPRLDEWCEGRRAAAEAYRAAGLGELVGLPVIPGGAVPAWHLYVVTSPEPDTVITRLAEAGIQARAYYRCPLHRQPSLAAFVRYQAPLPVTETLSASNIALPISPVLREQQAVEVVEAIAAALAPARG